MDWLLPAALAWLIALFAVNLTANVLSTRASLEKLRRRSKASVPRRSSSAPRHGVKRGRLVVFADGSVALAGAAVGAIYDVEDEAVNVVTGRDVVPRTGKRYGFNAFLDSVELHRQFPCLAGADHGTIIVRPAGRPLTTFDTARRLLRGLVRGEIAMSRRVVIVELASVLLTLPLAIIDPLACLAITVPFERRWRRLVAASPCPYCAPHVAASAWQHWRGSDEIAHVVPVDLEVELAGTVVRYERGYQASWQHVLSVTVPPGFTSAHPDLPLDILGVQLGTVVRSVAPGEHMLEACFRAQRPERDVEDFKEATRNLRRLAYWQATGRLRLEKNKIAKS